MSNKLDTDKIISDIYDLAIGAKNRQFALQLIEDYLISNDVFGIKKCRQCNSIFVKITKWQKYCCEDCKFLFFERQHGEKFDPTKYKRFGRPNNGLEAINLNTGILVRQKSKR